MIRFRKYTNLILTVFTVAGLFVSVIHYHSESLKCLSHSDDIHITQDTDICNICLTHVETDFFPTLDAEILPDYERLPALFDSFEAGIASVSLNTSRAPPPLVSAS